MVAIRRSTSPGTGHTPSVPTSKRGRLTASTQEAIWGYFFLAPWLVGLVIFTAWPILSMIYNSFTTYNVLTPPQWVGLANYREMLTVDPLFWKTFWNTCYYMGLFVPLELGLSFVAALLINRQIRGMRFFRVALYLPCMTPFTVTAVMWRFILSRQGLLNWALVALGLPEQLWLASETWVKPATVMLNLFYIGSAMVIFLSGLQSIPKSLYETSQMDGANGWEQFRHVTLPLMTPTILFNLILMIIGAFQVFNTSYVLTGGGPRNASLFYVHYIYRCAFQSLTMGYASALTVVLFLVVLALTVLLFRSSESWVHYERV